MHLGRAFVTGVVLRVAPLQYLRCRSITHLTADTLFAAPGTDGAQSFAALLDRTGRVESVQFPFTDRPWVKTWEVCASLPQGARRVTAPFNYAFSDNFPR